MPTRYGIILAGGSGSRLWPLSSKNRPKPFLPLKTKEPILVDTYQRLSPLVTKVFVNVNEEHVGLAKNTLGIAQDQIISEKNPLNTAAAIVRAIRQIDNRDAVYFFVPSDQWFSHDDFFRVGASLFSAVSDNPAKVHIAGSSVKHFDPSLGYFSINEKDPKGPVTKFAEKPLMSDIYDMRPIYANMGLFCGTFYSFKKILEWSKVWSACYDNEINESEVDPRPFDYYLQLATVAGMFGDAPCARVFGNVPWKDLGKFEQTTLCTGKFTDIDAQCVIEKPWGCELIAGRIDVTNKAQITEKYLFVLPGNALSLQYHHEKTEFMRLVSGKAKLTLVDKEHEMEIGKRFNILASTIHRIEAEDLSIIHEISYGRDDDIVRLDDRYGR